jgi:hypothetical protein
MWGTTLSPSAVITPRNITQMVNILVIFQIGKKKKYKSHDYLSQSEWIKPRKICTTG